MYPDINRGYILLVLAAVNFTHIVDSMIIMPLGDTFVKEFNLSAQQFAFLVSSYAIAAALSSFIGIFKIDSYDRKRLLLITYGGFSLATLLCVFAGNYTFLIIARLLTGFFGGVIGAVVLSIISDIFPFSERGSAMGKLFGAFSAASALGIPLGIYLAAKSSWHMPFLVISIMGAVIWILIYLKFPKLDKHLATIKNERSPKEILSSIFTDSNQRWGLTSGFTLILTHFMIIPFISPYMSTNIGFTQEQVSFVFLFGGLFTVVSAPIVGKLTDKYKAIKVFPILMLLSFIPTYMITNMKGGTPLLIAYTITTMFFVFASGRMISANTVISATAPVQTRGSFMALNSSLQQLAIALVGIISGAIVTLGVDGKYVHYNYVGYIAICLGLFTLTLIPRLKIAKGN
jgi:MFS transporter, DHA1 family, inner membrane transport protein